MRMERFEEAWDLAERALAARHPRTRDDPNLPYHRRWVWDHRPFDGRHVVVRCYHGLGDTIQYMRYLPLLAERVASLTVEIQPRLLPLAASMPIRGRFVPFDQAHPLPHSECDMEIMELDLALREPPTRAQPPYVRVPPAPVPAGTVGLCYGSGGWDQERDVPVHLLRRFSRLVPCLTLVPEPTDLDVLNPGGCPYDMAITASLVAAVDLVITVDTMIAHLAGAVGRPTWLLLKAEPDWRWAPDATATAWYPSMRLYAQSSPGDWTDVIARVERDWAMRTLSAAERRP